MTKREFVRRYLEKCERYTGPLTDGERRELTRRAKALFKRFRFLFELLQNMALDPSQEHPF